MGSTNSSSSLHKRDKEKKEFNRRVSQQNALNAIEREKLAIKKIEANKKKPHKVWTGNRERIQAALNEYQQCAANHGKYLAKAIEDKSECTHIITECKVKLSAIQKVLHDFSKEEKLIGIMTDVRGFRQKFEDIDTAVRAVINKTCVHSSNISDFLQLTANIIPTVLQCVQQTNNLNASFEAFYHLISRECRDKLTVDCYLEHEGLERFVPTLLFQQMLNVEDLECDDEKEFKEEILAVLQSAIDVAKEQKVDDEKENELAKDLKRTEKKKLKKICLKPDTWKEFQRQKSALNKRILFKCGPPLIKFFERTHIAMSDVTKLLEIGYEYNSEQQLALQDAPPPEIPMKSITVSANVNNDSGSPTEIPMKSITIVDIDYDDEEDVKYDLNADNEDDSKDTAPDLSVVKLKNVELSRISHDNMIIGNIAISTINIIESMAEDFAVSEKAKTFALNIEDTCGKLVRAQCSLRRNVALAMEIAKLKPAHMTDEAKKLWKAVDDGCIQIFSSAVDMIAVSAQYFGFFLRFKDSFGRYMEAMDMDENCSFVVSLEYLKKDLRDFMSFKDTYGSRLKQLNETAMKCIADCVTNAVGGQNFESAKKDWAESQELYLDALQRLQIKETKIDEEYLRLKNKESVIVAEIEKNEFLWETADDIINRIGNKQTKWDEEIAKLQKELKGANDFATEWK